MPSVDVLKIINTLLPGFLAAWIFYGLTAHPRKEMFERIVQALIFTAIVQICVFPFRKVSHWLGFGPRSEESKLLLSMTIACVLGVAYSGLANNNVAHRLLYNIRGENWELTKRTSFPSEWYSAFNQDRKYVILHFEDERRLFGWPSEWPDQPDAGHFVMQEAEWLLDTNERLPLVSVDRMLIPARMVKIVEFLSDDDKVV